MSDVTTGPLRQYLQEGRDAMMRALEELGEYDARRPLTPSGTNILGLVKHLVGVERSYLGECVGRPPKFTLPWEEDGSIWDGADMWVRADESRDYNSGRDLRCTIGQRALSRCWKNRGRDDRVRRL